MERDDYKKAMHEVMQEGHFDVKVHMIKQEEPKQDTVLTGVVLGLACIGVYHGLNVTKNLAIMGYHKIKEIRENKKKELEDTIEEEA